MEGLHREAWHNVPFDYQSSHQSLCKAESAVMMGRCQANAAPEVYQALEVACKAFGVSRGLVPVEPVQRGVMAVCVVVPTLQQFRGWEMSEPALLHKEHCCCCHCGSHIRTHAASVLQVRSSLTERLSGCSSHL